MSLRQATTLEGVPLALGTVPIPCDELHDWMGVPVLLPADDPFVEGSGDAAHAYLDAARQAWEEIPEWMDTLDLDSPAWHLKQAERDLYLHWWGEHLDADLSGTVVLDVGCGVGRMSMPLLDRGATVHGVDADLQSLQHMLWHAANRPGQLDLHWSSVHHLPDVTARIAVCCEVLCYVPDAVGALRSIADRVESGGVVLLSLEARWGWATSQDAPAGAIEAALEGDGRIDLPGDRWVQTYTEERFRALAEAAGLEVERLVPMLYLPDGPLEDVMEEEHSLEELLALEERARTHPVWGPLNRMWTGVLRKP